MIDEPLDSVGIDQFHDIKGARTDCKRDARIGHHHEHLRGTRGDCKFDAGCNLRRRTGLTLDTYVGVTRQERPDRQTALFIPKLDALGLVRCGI